MSLQRNDELIRLIHYLAALEGGWWSWLSESCQAICEHLHVDHACVYVLSTAEFWASIAACAGAGAGAAAGRAFSSDPRFNGSAPAALLRLQQERPSQLLLYRSTPTSAFTAGAAVPAGRVGPTISSSRDSSGTSPSPIPSTGPHSAADDLPGDWQQLYEEHGLNQFAAVGLAGPDSELVGVLSLGAKGPCRPAGWTCEALHCTVALMAPHLRRAQAVLASPAVSQLHAAATFSDLVNAAAEAAVEAAEAVAYVRGQSRVAFIGEGTCAAAIFQQQKQDHEPFPAQLPLLKARRSSCDFVLPRRGGAGGGVGGGSVRKATCGSVACPVQFQLSVDVGSTLGEQASVIATERGTVTTTDNLKRESWTPQQTVQTLPSFTFPSSKGTCQGHTLTLGKTLLSEALSKQVAGLCIDDCQAYTVRMKAYPRDLVLSRGAVLPMSLALATASDESCSPRMALYVTYGTCLPRPLLQAVVQELQQLLQALLPVIKARLSGGILLEYEYLTAQLQEAVHRTAKPSAPQPATATASSITPAVASCEQPPLSDMEPRSYPPNESRMLSFILGARAAGGSNAPGGRGAGEPPHGRAGEPPNGGAIARISFPHLFPPSPPAPGAAAAPLPAVPAATHERAPSLVAPPTPTATNSSAAHAHALGLQLAPIGGHFGGGATAVTNEPHSGEASLAAVPPWAAPRCDAAAAAAAATAAADHAAAATAVLEGDVDLDIAVHHRSGSASQVPDTCRPRPQSACAVGTGGEAQGRLRSRLGIRSVSFRLEAAQAPRGASKLAPLIASMHERLRAAQAVQMTFVRSEVHKTDLKSLKLLQEIGQGGYGTVYRGTFHGTEVAVKIIKQSRLAGVASSSNILASSHCLGLHKQNLHDAIELVASVSMSHINIVQVPAYFMDIRLEKPEEFNPLDSVDQPSESRPFRLVHSPSLLESPAPGQDGHGDFAMALVLEYCDCGSLCDAILNRKFIERVTAKKPAPANSASATSAKTYLAINMRSVYLTLLEIALALRHMHSLALVHCDLKPQNVLLKSSPRDPRGFTAKLSDFGLAKMMAHDDEGQLVIDEAVASGTITHVAPEVLLGQKALGAAVDIYAFGIMMYQVLCGMKVYDKALSASSIANSVAHRLMRPQLPAWVPSSYRALAQACWHHVPSARPTADELVRHLERALEAKRNTTGGVGGGSGSGARTSGSGR